MRSLFVTLILFVAVSFAPQLCRSQAIADSSSATTVQARIDTTASDTLLRPRSMGSYIVGCYPSPAGEYEPVTVQTYNRDAEILSVTVYDNAGHTLLALIPEQTVPAGLQTISILPGALPSGVYHVQLLTYTASGVPDVVDEARFIIAR